MRIFPRVFGCLYFILSLFCTFNKVLKAILLICLSDNYFLYPKIIVIYDYVHLESTVLINILSQKWVTWWQYKHKICNQKVIKNNATVPTWQIWKLSNSLYFFEKSRSTCFLPKVFLQSTNTILFSHKNKLHETNTNIEFGGKILWKIMQRCRRGIIYKLPNSFQKESRSTHFWPRKCPGQWHFWVSSMSEKNELLALFKSQGYFYGFWGVSFPFLLLFFVVLIQF